MMNLRFNYRDIPLRNKGLTFDDVLLTPCKSEIQSRRDPNLRSRLTKTKWIETPMISANMDTITGAEMAIAMNKLGGIGILHRFLSIEDQIRDVKLCLAAGVKDVAASIGVSDDFKERGSQLIEAGVNIITIDIAHGHSVSMFETIEWMKKNHPHVEIIAGNLATPEAALDLINAGADALKVGIGPGSMCTTRIITGCGVPQLTAIAMVALAVEKTGVPIIADGGLKTSGDIVKAFAAGADTVMLGSLLSGTLETPGEIKSGKKQYRGMASKAAQVSWRGGVPKGMAAEGESTLVNIKGHVADVILELTGGVRSGMSYLNATEFAKIKENALFIEMSSAGSYESRAHGL